MELKSSQWLGWLKKAIAALAFVLLSLAKGKVVMFNVGKTNAAMACPVRPQANKADECRTLKNNTDSPNHQVFKMLSTWRVKTIHIGNTRILNYATLKKKVLNHSTVLVLHPHLAVLHNPLLFNTINSCINTSFHLFSLMQRELDFFFNWVFFFLLPSREKLQPTLQKCFCVDLLLSQLQKQLLGYAISTCNVAIAVTPR